MHQVDVNLKILKKKSLYSRISSFSYKFSVLKTCIDYLKIHSKYIILMQFFKTNSPGDPRIPTCGREWSPPVSPPFGASASAKPSAILGICAPGS